MPEISDFYPHAIDCYLLKARDGLPPHPEDKPVASHVVHSDEDAKRTKEELISRYPGCWCIARPLDWE